MVTSASFSDDFGKFRNRVGTVSSALGNGGCNIRRKTTGTHLDPGRRRRDDDRDWLELDRRGRGCSRVLAGLPLIFGPALAGARELPELGPLRLCDQHLVDHVHDPVRRDDVIRNDSDAVHRHGPAAADLDRGEFAAEHLGEARLEGRARGVGGQDVVP